QVKNAALCANSSNANVKRGAILGHRSDHIM
ncbi:MAG: hypothetical protein ACI9TA_003130, partial [Reinekea sp.]